MSPVAAAANLLLKDLILESVHDAIVVVDRRCRIEAWNPAAEALYGWSGAEVIRRPIDDVVPVLRYLDGSSCDCVREELAARGSWSGAIVQRHRDGRELSVEVVCRALHDRHSAIAGFVTINRPIPQRNRVEQAPHESDVPYRALAEHFPNGAVFLFDQDLRYTIAGGTGLEATGLSREMFEGKTIWEIFPPEIAERDAPVLQAALRGEATRVEVPFGEKTFIVRTLPVKDDGGAIVGGMVMTQDVTERKLAEARLHFMAEASAILGASLDYETTLGSIARLSVPLLADTCAVFVVATNGTIRRVAAVNVDRVIEEQLRDLCGHTRIDPAGEHPAAVAIRTRQPVVNPARPGVPAQAVMPASGQRGTAHALIPAAFIVVPLVARGQALGAIVFGRSEVAREYDAEELRLAEEIARRVAQAMDHAHLYQQAQQALRTRDEFMSIAAHELKTPLTTLLGSTEILQRRAAGAQPYTMTDRDQQSLRVIVQQSRRLQQQIDTLLDLSHIHAGRLSLDPKPTDLCSLVGRIVDEVRPALERHQVVFTCHEPPYVVNADELRLEQVVVNLLQNAIKYSPDGGEIGVRIGREGADVRLEVSDRGIGIPAEEQAQLFERFYRAGNAAGSPITGLGIGLAVVKDIVTRHGGRVEVTSVEGQGSTFAVWLPEYAGKLDVDTTSAEA